MNYNLSCHLKKIFLASFRESCQWLKFTLNGLQAQSRVSPVVGLLPVASGLACLGMAFPPFVVKQLYSCESVVISSFARAGYTTRRWGWLLGRIGYSVMHHYPLFKRSWIQHVNRMDRNRLPRVMKHYSPTGRKNHGRPLKRLLDTWDQNGSTSGPTPWKIYYDDDDNLSFWFLWYVPLLVFFHHLYGVLFYLWLMMQIALFISKFGAVLYLFLQIEYSVKIS